MAWDSSPTPRIKTVTFWQSEVSFSILTIVRHAPFLKFGLKAMNVGKLLSSPLIYPLQEQEHCYEHCLQQRTILTSQTVSRNSKPLFIALKQIVLTFAFTIR